MGCKYDRLPAFKWLSIEASALEKYAVPEPELF